MSPYSHRLRRALLLIALPTLALARASASDLSFVRVWPGWQEADAFHRISEYFTDRINPGVRIILRTHADARSGFYFLVRVKNPGSLVPGVKFVVRVIVPASQTPETFTFPTDVPAGGKVYQLGLTGADWPGPKVFPVAWKLDLLDANDQVLATQQSFLWAQP
jgi:hypothetical protein